MLEVPDGRRRTRDDHIPAHLPAMNPDKVLAVWMGKRRLADTGLDLGSAACDWDWMQEPGERCDAAFLENREPCDHRVCRKNFCESPRKNFR